MQRHYVSGKPFLSTAVLLLSAGEGRISQPLGACPRRAANTAVLTEGERSLINDPARFEGVRVIGVDEHVWRHTPYGDKNRHRHLGPDTHPRSQWPLPALRHGSGPLQKGLQNLAGLTARHVA